MPSTSVDIKFTKVTDNAIPPTYGTEHSAGADLYALNPVTLYPGQTVRVSAGIKTEIPEGYVGLIFARSGLATKQGIAPANCVGVIDSDYRGEWYIPLHNSSKDTYDIHYGDRIAQVIILPYPKANYIPTDTLTNTERGEGGFGSTGANIQ